MKQNQREVNNNLINETLAVSTHGPYPIEAFSTEIVLLMKGQLINFSWHVTKSTIPSAVVLNMTTGSFRTTVFYPNWSWIRSTNSVHTCGLNIIRYHACKKVRKEDSNQQCFPIQSCKDEILKLGSLLIFNNLPWKSRWFQTFSPKVLNGSWSSSSHWATIRDHWTHLSWKCTKKQRNMGEILCSRLRHPS